jgi:MFS family permease
VILGAFGALGSYALFHLVTVFPLSWILLYSSQSITAFLAVQIVGAVLFASGIVASGRIADRIGRRNTLGVFAILIAVFSGFAPTLLDGGALGQDVFILLGFSLLGLSYGQAAGAMNASFEPR